MCQRNVASASSGFYQTKSQEKSSEVAALKTVLLRRDRIAFSIEPQNISPKTF